MFIKLYGAGFILEFVYGQSDLLAGVPGSHRHSIIFKRLKIYSYGFGRADFVLAVIALTDIAVIVEHYCTGLRILP